MPGFPDTAVIVILALLLFGPKKLPVLARQLGKLMADFRRASNEFRTQMEEELRISEQADRQREIAALEAAKPAAIPAPESTTTPPSEPTPDPSEITSDYMQESLADLPAEPAPVEPPQPIATSGELSILPPSTGLPVPNTPSAEQRPSPSDELQTETLHG